MPNDYQCSTACKIQFRVTKLDRKARKKSFIDVSVEFPALDAEDTPTFVHVCNDLSMAFVVSASPHLRVFDIHTGSLLDTLRHVSQLSGTYCGDRDAIVVLD